MSSQPKFNKSHEMLEQICLRCLLWEFIGITLDKCVHHASGVL